MRPLIVPQPVTTPSPGKAVLVGVEVGVAVLDEHVELLERIRVEQQFDALARRQLAAGVLRRDARFAAAQAGLAAAFVEILDDLFHGHDLQMKESWRQICGRQARRSRPRQRYEFGRRFEFDRMEAARASRLRRRCPIFRPGTPRRCATGRRLRPASRRPFGDRKGKNERAGDCRCGLKAGQCPRGPARAAHARARRWPRRPVRR